MSTPNLARVVYELQELYPPSFAEAWDAVGLVCGDPAAPIRKVMFAVDPVAAVVNEALAWGADLLVTHHPLYLRPVSSVAATTFKGSVVHRLIRGECALYVAHTNADSAANGVADALADALGLLHRVPLISHPSPTVASMPPTVAATGHGRLGRLPAAMTLGRFAAMVAQVLPATHHGVRVAGDLDAMVESIAVSGGSGDGFFDAVRTAHADVYVTADLRHHPASELRERALMDGGPAGTPFLVDVAHFASEWPWLAFAARDLAARLAAGTTSTPGVEMRVSTVVTDPWTAHLASALPVRVAPANLPTD